MPMGMKETMGLLTQLKRMRQPDVISGNQAGPGLHADPGMRLGSFYGKNAESPLTDQQQSTLAWFNAPGMMERRREEYSRSTEGIDEQIRNLEQQLVEAQKQLAQAIESRSQYRADGLRQMIATIKEQIIALQRQKEEASRSASENAASQPELLQMGARTSGRSPAVTPYQHVGPPTNFGTGGGGSMIGRRGNP